MDFWGSRKPNRVGIDNKTNKTMKKKVLLIAAIAILVVSAPAALSAMKSWPTNSNGNSWPNGTTINTPNETQSKWVMVSDPNCGRCVMNDVDRKCGKPNCGGFMAQVDGTGKFEGDYLQYDYKCNKCGHTIKYKQKYK